jgi:hypothetical protein
LNSTDKIEYKEEILRTHGDVGEDLATLCLSLGLSEQKEDIPNRRTFSRDREIVSFDVRKGTEEAPLYAPRQPQGLQPNEFATYVYCRAADANYDRMTTALLECLDAAIGKRKTR